ncbi:HicB family protein [Amycolatopsis arida]|uniref:HicB family protein n=1 Tax=Amycolatopsis arida TaxID=587909 RepID=A0A1I5VF55_9PSEU|nr:toxin-antitoxin system HicB family antitoxin [Amycolatopsis arida]TDX91260.1 HicB-like protein involved in pilus formation [Amycolatopsis arida]SFQ06109.1 HicB family protein [Amycolatopsis arida]
MDLTPYLEQLREDLATAASAGDEQTRRTAAVLGAALEPAARLALMNALSDLAAEVTAHLADHVVEVRLDGRDVRVVVTGGGSGTDGDTAPPPPPPPPPTDAGGDISRITLRLFEQIKEQAEQAAAAQGVSLNTFVSQAVQGALHGKGHRRDPHWSGPSDTQLHGWVRG